MTTTEKQKTYSKKQIQKAGEYLILENSHDDIRRYIESLEALSYWRSVHAPALEATVEILNEACKKHTSQTMIASRLKRAPSIISKLKRFNEMKLRNMQDIGGCRAILKNKKTLSRIYKEINRGGEFKYKNYIEKPKDDGYRGIHIIHPVNTPENIYKIEIQLRTEAQHAWSTAVEIVDLFTNQNIKSNKGRDEWKDFFKAASAEIEKLENGSLLTQCESLETFMSLLRKMKIKRQFQEFSSLVNIIDAPDEDDGEYILLKLTKNSKTIVIKYYKKDQISEAFLDYLEEEKIQKTKNTPIAALVSLSSIHSLKAAYPNYFADSKYFIQLIERIEAIGEIIYPSNFWYRFLSNAGFGKMSKEQTNKITTNSQ